MQHNVEVVREEIVQILAKNLPQQQVIEVRQLLADYFAKKATEEFDTLTQQNNWNNQTFENWVNED